MTCVNFQGNDLIGSILTEKATKNMRYTKIIVARGILYYQNIMDYTIN